MKKILIVLCVLLVAAVPPVSPDGKDWNHTGSHTYTKQLTIQGKILSGAKIDQYDNVVAQMADSISLSDAIQSLQVILIPKLTTTQINALAGVEEGTFVYDSSLHVLKFYNGTTWKTVTTD